ncbi:helix-turn-helix domain-containing protein [Orbaceae bacterium ac157xtp]
MGKDNKIEQQEPIVSLGTKLVAGRERLGFSQQEVADKIKVRKTVIEQLENDLLIKVPAVFLKGYIKSYAELIGLHEEEYKPHLDSLSNPNRQAVIHNYSSGDVKRKRTKKLFFISLFVVCVVVGVVLFFMFKEDKSHLVEVNHYVTPSTTSLTHS